MCHNKSLFAHSLPTTSIFHGILNATNPGKPPPPRIFPFAPALKPQPLLTWSLDQNDHYLVWMLGNIAWNNRIIQSSLFSVVVSGWSGGRGSNLWKIVQWAEYKKCTTFDDATSVATGSCLQDPPTTVSQPVWWVNKKALLNRNWYSGLNVIWWMQWMVWLVALLACLLVHWMMIYWCRIKHD